MKMKTLAAAIVAAFVSGSVEAQQRPTPPLAPPAPVQAPPATAAPAPTPPRPTGRPPRAEPPTTVTPAQGAPASPAPQAAPPAPPAAAAPAPLPLDVDPINVRYQIGMRDTGGPQPGTKTVTMTATLGQVSSVRATGTVGGRGSYPLNVDVWPTAIRDGKVQTRISIEYVPQSPPNTVGPPPLSIRQTVYVWLDNRTDMVVSTAADPTSDRRLEVAARAEILR